MKILKRILSVAIIVAMLACIFMMSTISSSASGTGVGLAEWCLNAYNSGWSYVYGGASPGAVDCSGLIYSYAGGIRTGDAQLYNSDYIGYVSNGVPRIHGLGLWKPGHVGVYICDGMAVDARGSQWGVCYESVYSHGWTKYFKVPGVSYPTNGWVTFNGSDYYYENGQYVVNTTKTINGVSYTFGSNGKCTSSSGASNSGSSSSTSTTSSSTLKNGSSGDAVVKLQTRLYELGYYNGPIDGSFGDGTEEAFKLFQAQAGLYVDGLAGSDVEYLYSDSAPKYDADEINEEIVINNKKEETETAQTGTTQEDEDDSSFEKGDYHDDIVPIQERLIELSYLEGMADGSFGSATEQAIMAFQAANGITQTGIADEFTVEVLFSVAAVENPDKKETTQTLEVVDSELPQSPTEVEPTPASDIDATEVALETNKMSEKALAGIASTMNFKSDSNGNNFQFIFWLVVMIVVMSITFFIIQAVENKKSGKKKEARKYF